MFEALLASIAVAWFAYALSSLDASDQSAMVQVIYFYSSVCLVTGPLLWLILDSGSGQADDAAGPAQGGASLGQTLRDLGDLLRNIRIWLVALCILAGYQIFYATYSYSNYLQVQFGLSAVAVGGLTTVRLWMRPLGAVIAGFVGDRFHPVRIARRSVGSEWPIVICTDSDAFKRALGHAGRCCRGFIRADLRCPGHLLGNLSHL